MAILLTWETDNSIIWFPDSVFIVPYRVASSLSRSFGMATNVLITPLGMFLTW